MKKIKYLLIIFISTLCVLCFKSIKHINAETNSLFAGKELSIGNLSGNLNNINIKIEFTTTVNLDGENNALLVGLTASDGTILTDARFVVSQTNSNVFDCDGVNVQFINAPLTIGTKTLNGKNYTYTIETRDFTVVNNTKNISKFVIIGQKGTEINTTVNFSEIKYSVKFGNNEATLYSYNEAITAPSKTYKYTYTGHQEVTGYTGDDSSSFINGTTCATKNIVYTEVYSASVNHTWKTVNEVKATREQNGVIKHEECTCGAKRIDSGSTKLISDTELVSKHTCSYNVSFDWTNAKNPGDKPTITYTCKLEGCGYSHPIDSKDITVKEKEGSKIPATYEENGSIVFIASSEYEGTKATEEKTYVLVKLYHVLTHHDAVNETCDTDGNIEYWSCSDCNKNFSDEDGTIEVTTITIPKHHNLNKHDSVNPTCLTGGNIEYYECSVCHNKFSDNNGLTEVTETVLPKIDHNLTYHKAIDATCTTDGSVEYYECSMCKAKFSDANSTKTITNITIKGEHDLAKHSKKEATCEKDGSIEYYECLTCGKFYTDKTGETEVKNTIIKASGHKYDANGTCEVCGKTNANGAQATDLLGCLSMINATGVVYALGLAVIILKKRKIIININKTNCH